MDTVGTIRKANSNDFTFIRDIYTSAKEYMDATGNPNQWAKGYPPDSMILGDIANENLYVICDGNNTPHAVFALIKGEDPTYKVIEGKWLNGNEYVTLHRVGSDGFFGNVMGQITRYAFLADHCSDIRIDTHADNKAMQKALDFNGYVYCGIIHLANGNPRNAYQKISTDK